ncbi:tail fiber assembly protein [Aeromonas jandaei]|uniref:tail fiber assembly protein n=1 Tax=Aeromonas jandaei TaxID=650 RepID=UPI001ADDC07E|nr:tail fiber assembly protein [Aeromonas jandaei]QTL95524.1 Caudovirales tail fiber assembly protein [Aeromonas jandaei]
MKRVLNVRNVTAYSDRDVLDMEVEFDTDPGVFIPFAAMQDDSEQHGRDLYERAQRGEFGPINVIYVDQLQAAEQSARMRQSDAITFTTALISPLQDACDLGMATPEELIRLDALKRHRIALMRLPQHEGWPMNIELPEVPL